MFHDVFEIEINGCVYEAEVEGEALDESRFDLTSAVVTHVYGLVVEEGDEDWVEIEHAEGDDVVKFLESADVRRINENFAERLRLGPAY